MKENRKTYYISIPCGEIFQQRGAAPWNFQIRATQDEIAQLRKYFDRNSSVSGANFYRAHIPFLEYHYDRENDVQDIILQKVYEIIYRLGDDEAKKHIESMGILQAQATDNGLRY